MENLVNGNQTERAEQKTTPTREGNAKKAGIPLHPVTGEVSTKGKRYNYFFYQRGKTKIECEGSPDKAVRVALVDTISRWMVRLLIGGTSLLVTHVTAKKVFGSIKSPGEKRPYIEYQKSR